MGLPRRIGGVDGRVGGLPRGAGHSWLGPTWAEQGTYRGDTGQKLTRIYLCAVGAWAARLRPCAPVGGPWAARCQLSCVSSLTRVSPPVDGMPQVSAARSAARSRSAPRRAPVA